MRRTSLLTPTRRLLVALGVLVSITAIGTAGYALLERLSPPTPASRRARSEEVLDMARAPTRGSLRKVRESVRQICRGGEELLVWLRRDCGSFARFERRIEELQRVLGVPSGRGE